MVTKKRRSRKDDDSDIFDEKWFKDLNRPRRDIWNIIFFVVIIVLAVSTIGINAFLINEYTNSIQEYDSSRELYSKYVDEIKNLKESSYILEWSKIPESLP